jgi:hypothetical protein
VLLVHQLLPGKSGFLPVSQSGKQTLKVATWKEGNADGWWRVVRLVTCLREQRRKLKTVSSDVKKL